MNEQESYKRAFDSIDDRPAITVDSLMNRRRVRRKAAVKKAIYTAFVFSALFLGSNVITYAQNGEPWIKKVLSFRTGNGVEFTMKEYQPDDSNSTISEIKIDTNNSKDYCYAKDRRIYFAFNDKEEDITDQCGADSYYKYEYTDENGYRHLIICGGTVDNPGWAEYILDDEDVVSFSMMSDSVAMDSLDGENLPRITIVKKVENKEGSDTPSENVTVFDDNSPMTDNPELPAWLDKAEKDLQIGNHVVHQRSK